MYLEVDLQIAPIEIRHFREIVSQYLSSVSVYYYLYTGKRIKFDFPHVTYPFRTQKRVITIMHIILGFL